MSAPVPDPHSTPAAEPNPPGKPARPIAVTLIRKSAAAAAAAPDPATGTEPEPSKPSLTLAAPSVAQKPIPAPPQGVPGTPSPGERITAILLRPAVCAPILILSVALLGWTFLVRWPSRPILAHARPAPMPVSPVETSTPVAASREKVDALRAAATAALTQVVTNRDQLPAVIASIEQEARAAGFVTELTARLPFSPVPGFPELQRHPVGLRLENDYERPEPAFARLMAWMRRVSTMGVKVEFTAVTLHSLGDGVASATVELHLTSLPVSFNAKVTPE